MVHRYLKYRAILLFQNSMPINSNSTIELLNPDEVARLLKISKAGVYRLIDKRLIRFYKVMGSIRFDRNDVVSFLQNNRIEVIGSHKYVSAKN